MKEYLDTIIVGGGQAGLAVSYYLTQQGRSHAVLEQSPQPANAWRNHRWDSFTFVTPNWMTRLPGAEYHGADPDGFMSRSEIVTFFEQYVERFKLPVRYDVQVTAIEQESGSYTVTTSKGAFQSANVVIATGLFQKPKIPSFSAQFPPEISQLHSSEYRNSDALPAGAVLVIGSGQSGCQIAEELSRTQMATRSKKGGLQNIPGFTSLAYLGYTMRSPVCSSELRRMRHLSQPILRRETAISRIQVGLRTNVASLKQSFHGSSLRD
jgi:putative flavoprotein involved in K+ transport